MSELTTRPVTRPTLIAWPPALFLIALLGGLALHRVAPFEANNGAAAQLLGTLITGMGLVVIACTVREFRRYRTSYLALREARCIIRTGPFSMSRNPMYVAMTALLIGSGLLLNALWIVVSAIPVILILSRHVVPNEESAFSDAFGDDYRDYRQSVRRWI